MSSSIRPRSFARVAPLVVMLASFFAQLGPAYADEALARQHFKKGIELYDKKKYVEALAAFEDAYKEKPSGGIKQNIALSYKGMNRYVEAATAFDDALADTSLKPETRAAIERELADLEKHVATVRFTVATADKKPLDQAVIWVEPAGDKPRMLGPESQKKPLRLAPGVYTFVAKSAGYPDHRKPPLSLVAGPPVDISFTLGAGAAAVTAVGGEGGGQGTLKLRPSVEDASIRIDGKTVGRGAWEGTLGAGVHEVEVSAPGFKTTKVEVSIPAGGAVDYPLTLQATSETPPEYTAAATPKPKKDKKLYVVPMLAFDSTSYRLSDDVGEPASGSVRHFVGGTLGGRVGYFLTRHLAAEALIALGAQKADYGANDSTTISHWQLTPALRVRIPRDAMFRFTAATGFGLHGLNVEAKLDRDGREITRKGAGGGWSWLIDLGTQVDLGPVFLEGALVFDVHSLPAVRDQESPKDRFLLSSPAVRGGLRAGLGIPF